VTLTFDLTLSTKNWHFTYSFTPFWLFYIFCFQVTSPHKTERRTNGWTERQMGKRYNAAYRTAAQKWNKNLNYICTTIKTKRKYCKTLYFRISRFWNVKISLHFNLAFYQYSTSIYQAFDGQNEFSWVFNFAVLSYSRNSRKFDARKKYVLQ